MSNKGFTPWRPDRHTQPWLDDVLEVINSQLEYWPLTQRYWLYRLIALKAWSKADEYAPSKAPKNKRHLCTRGKNLNNILTRGRRAGVIPWEAIAGSRGSLLPPTSVDTPEQLADKMYSVIGRMQFDRQRDQDRRVVLWMETEGMIPLVKATAHYYGATVLAGQGFDILDNKYKFAQTIAKHGDVLILHAGDLDKSGHTLFVSLYEDLQAFVSELGGKVELERIALTEAQALEYDLQTTPVVAGLNAGNHGKGFTSSVECQLEAMDAPDIVNIIEFAFEENLDMDIFDEQIEAEAGKKAQALKILQGMEL